MTTCGGIEEDFMKCLAPTYIGDFKLNGEMLRKKGLNRIGNLLVPNNNYCEFEDWVNPILESMTNEQVSLFWMGRPFRHVFRQGERRRAMDSLQNHSSPWQGD